MKQVNIPDLKFGEPKGSCRFDSGQAERFLPVRFRPAVQKIKKLYIYTHMKKVIFTLMIATMFVACSVPTETPVVDSTAMDSTIVSDSTIKSDSLVKDTL